MTGNDDKSSWGGADALAWLVNRGAPAAPRPVARAPLAAPALPRDPPAVGAEIANAVYFKALDSLRAERTAAGVAAAAAAAATTADAAWEATRPDVEARKQPGFACSAGCAWCCHQQVAASPAEAVVIARHVLRTFPAEALAGLKARLAKLDGESRGLGAAERARLKRPCAFLENGECSIYAVRPLRCRGVYSRDAAHCQWAMENPGQVFGDPDRHARPGPYPVEPAKIMDAALSGLARALRDQGLAWQALELTAALRVALDTPGASERYLAGEPVFAGTELPAAEP